MSPAFAIVVGAGLIGGTIALTRAPIERLAFIAVGAFVLTITWNGVRVAGGAFGNAFLTLAAIAVLAHVVVDRQRIAIPPWLLAAAGGMVLAALIVAIFPPSLPLQNRSLIYFNQLTLTAGTTVTAIIPNRSNFSALVKFEIALVVVPIVIVLVATTQLRINRLLDLWTISAVVNALVGLADYAGLHGVSPVAMIGHRAAGLTVHPNYLALTCALAMPTALRWVGRSRRGTIVGSATTLILVAGEYSTGSRDGNVAAAIGLVLTIAYMPRLRTGLRFVIPGLGMFFVVILTFTHTGHAIIDQLRLGGPTVSTTGSNYQRAVVAQVAEAQIRARPIQGVGFAVDNDAQNIYLQILAAGGLVAMSAFLVFIGGLATCVRRARHGPMREEAIAIGICVIVWLVNGYYDAQIADKYLYVLPGVLIACARATAVHRSAAPANVTPFPAPARALQPIGASASPTRR